jgi:hypothetical protein
LSSSENRVNEQYETRVLTGASTYISQDGLVRVRVKVGAGNPSCYYLDLGLQAVRAGG